MSEYQHIDVSPQLVEEYIMTLAKYGASHETGVWRTVYSPEWVEATDQYARWCEESGLAVKRDAVGNVWGVLEGSEKGKSIVSGSHIDSQTPGGRYDGALGALAALIALRCLKQQFGQPKRTLEAIAFCEEESSRFPAANFWGSRAITGRIRPEDVDNIIGFDGKSIGEAMRDIGLDPARIPEAKRDDIDTFIELHIEQGPILEQAGLPVGIVTAVTGIRHYEVELRGTQNHAGAFPMDLRRDPMQGFAEIASGVVNTAHRWGRPAVTTVGRVNVSPNATAVIPDRVVFTVDARHPDPASAEKLYATHEGMMREVAQRRNLDISWQVQINHIPCLSAPTLIKTLKEAADHQQIPTMTMASGAGHDTQQMAAIADVAMVFVKSKDGRSHTPDEFSTIEDIVQGIKVLAGALYKLAW
ncbi:allantoate amidohydrolase [Klebsiella pneumoniae]|uniref:Zn-dependent hydrolase n=1 Tax=Klebsiella pneumoniae TaxID=573 RepID=UPI000DE6C753|nr:Zn-dependent hydrolase [Klebsiella pneumoniae]HBX3663174.1 Zn-dependent hydrolase [Klebsiella pneumoniae subsp. pneumoniae]MBC4206704.1 Zn-dependent hydrolase [Klebsiella pneumoniae]MCE7515921.1 Zn-dependent hydrolase [Klebsiella pneumoniae]MCH9571787.1 Zn-dependent hydrolase [Klebsiella pneumoniae]MCJ4904933.1 Zn-dependent hydrolase [Klebsiella pneumoniae]